VIVEGPDGSGKTTLARRMEADFNLEYRRPPEELLSSSTGPSPGLLEWWREQLRRHDRADGVYDRCFWVSEPIYSSVMLRPPLCSPVDIVRGINDLWVEGPLLIFCMTEEVTMLENTFLAGRPRLADISDDQRKLKAINFLYWANYAQWLTMDDAVMHWDYNAHDYRRIGEVYGNWRKTKVA
jgi:hypothetical protein